MKSVLISITLSGVSTPLYRSLESWSSLSSQLGDLLSLFILLPCFDPVRLFGVKTPSFYWHWERLKTCHRFWYDVDFFSHKGFDFFLSLGVTTPLTTPVMGLSCLGSFAKDFFDVLKSIGFGDLVRHFSSSRQSDWVYFGWFVWNLLGRLFEMQASRWSVQAH